MSPFTFPLCFVRRASTIAAAAKSMLHSLHAQQCPQTPNWSACLKVARCAQDKFVLSDLVMVSMANPAVCYGQSETVCQEQSNRTGQRRCCSSWRRSSICGKKRGSSQEARCAGKVVADRWTPGVRGLSRLRSTGRNQTPPP